MSAKSSQDAANLITETFLQRTSGSGEWNTRAKESMPGGDTRAASFYTPYPAYMTRGEGCFLYDYDENQYLDFLNNYTSLIHGHAHPATVSAIQEQAARGTVLGSGAEATVEHAEMLCSRVPSFDSVRYCNSGTEATLLAMRAARAFTGKDIIIKMDGGYHGSHDYVQLLGERDHSRPHGRQYNAQEEDPCVAVPVSHSRPEEHERPEHHQVDDDNPRSVIHTSSESIGNGRESDRYRQTRKLNEHIGRGQREKSLLATLTMHQRPEGREYAQLLSFSSL